MSGAGIEETAELDTCKLYAFAGQEGLDQCLT